MARAVAGNRDELPYAWRCVTRPGRRLRRCALGTTGMRDWTMDGIHLTVVRLELPRLNTAPRARSRASARSSPRWRPCPRATCATWEGWLPEPIRSGAAAKGFRVVSWDEAYGAAAEKIAPPRPIRLCRAHVPPGSSTSTITRPRRRHACHGNEPRRQLRRALPRRHPPSRSKRTLGYGAPPRARTRDWLAHRPDRLLRL